MAMLASSIAEDLRAAIAGARYLPGDKLNEVAVASHYKVSRNTLREAFVTLAAEQLLVKIPNRGVFIASPDIDYIVDLYRARANIEPAAALWGEFLDVDYLVEQTNLAVQALNDSDMEALSTCNQNFHRALVNGVGSPTMDKEMSNLLARMRLTFLQVLPLYPELHAENVQENVKVAQLLARDKRYEAAEMLRSNMMMNLYRIISVLRTAEHTRQYPAGAPHAVAPEDPQVPPVA
ncbi:GntR family transcriptional regulator [Corynebacterium sp. L4756]|uniref:GntR family transcriptional regulator n=1 Tax=unclassified Corynebacterium TaxID=2624378 RepID=UPI00374CB1B0